MQRLELGGDGGEGVDRAAAGAVLVDRALHELLGARAPVLEVDAVALAEGVAHRPHVLGDGGTVDHHRLLFLGAGDQPLRAVGPLIGGDLGDASASARARGPAPSTSAAAKISATDCEELPDRHHVLPADVRAPNARATSALPDKISL